MDHSPKRHRIGNLTVEPDVFIGGEKPREPGTNNANNISEHRYQNQACIES